MDSAASSTEGGSGSVDASAGGEGSGDAPLTTTQSGLPIAPVFAGFANKYLRRKCFNDGHASCRK